MRVPPVAFDGFDKDLIIYAVAPFVRTYELPCKVDIALICVGLVWRHFKGQKHQQGFFQ